MFNWFLVEESQSPYVLQDWLNSLIGTKVAKDAMGTYRGAVEQIAEWQIVYDQDGNNYTAFVLCVCRRFKPMV